MKVHGRIGSGTAFFSKDHPEVCVRFSSGCCALGLEQARSTYACRELPSIRLDGNKHNSSEKATGG